MREALTSSYNHLEFEDEIYDFWLKNKFFRSKVDKSKKPYTIVMPPPNVTGVLHMGHVLNNSIQDVLIRYYRMNGYEACWIPGTDHASIATEAKVTKYLAEMGIDKFEIGREKFLEYAWEWKEKYGGIIISQLKKLGCSCDWDRERFTMDEGYYKAVIYAFVELYKKGYIYRGYRLVNWCPVSRSAISDEEVYYKEVEGKLYYFLYPIKDSKDFLEIATTRPETMLGDTAVAVNPADPRYRKYIGKTAILPIVNREIPVIADEYVDMEFGTGVVKITPAHDPNDYEIGLRHNLDVINILNPDGTLNNNVPEEFIGLDRFEAREAVVEKMKELKYLKKIENYTHKVGYSERGHVPIEPYLSEQWFLKMEELVKPAIEVVKEGKIKFFPERWTKIYFHWLESIKDWCISRQLWWGHRIPVFYCNDCGYYNAYVSRPEECEKCGSKNITQDPDVLDTWASSWLWPFAVHKWPEIDEDLKYYYPTETLVTAPEIIFFWVARMIIAGMEFLNEIPFRNVYFTGTVRDDIGRKMSKSLGNSPDPLDVIKEYGADALRYTILRLAPLGNDIFYDNEKCEIGRNFANKIWNAARFILNNSKDLKLKKLSDVKMDVFDRWILTKFNKSLKKLRGEIENFSFNDATVTLYEFIWNEFCDWYIEISKIKLYSENIEAKIDTASILVFLLENILKMIHPFMPFISEKIYQSLPGKDSLTIMKSSFPVYDEKMVFEEDEKKVEFLKKIIYNIRNLRGENKIPPSLNVDVKIKLEKKTISERFSEFELHIKKLAKVNNIEIVENYFKASTDIAGVGEGFEIYINAKDFLDVDKERTRLQKEIDRLTVQIKSTETKLKNPDFLEKAPMEVIEREEKKLANWKSELEKLKSALSSLG
ncbi:MAG: valine--tRNA ligase [Brevinematia bacterium]